MGQQINVNIRMDSDIKKQADLLFNDFGLNFTSAVNAFIRQALREKSIPFQIRIIDQSRKALSEEGRELMRSIQEDSVINGTDTMTMEEIDAEIAAYRRETRKNGTIQ